MFSLLPRFYSPFTTFAQMASSDMSDSTTDNPSSMSKIPSRLNTCLMFPQTESADCADEESLRARIGSRLSIRVVSSELNSGQNSDPDGVGLPDSGTSLFFPFPSSQAELVNENAVDDSTQSIDESENLEMQTSILPTAGEGLVETLDDIITEGTGAVKKLTIPTILVPDESSDASEQCGNDVDPMDAAIDDALDLVEAALLEMSNFTLGDRKLPTLSPVLSSKVDDSVISEFTTYASATNLALQHPGLASVILKQPLTARMTTSESGISYEESPEVIPAPVHAPDAPNWALAPDAPTDEIYKHKKAQSRSNSKTTRTPHGKGVKRGHKLAYNHRQSRDGHPRFQTVHINQPDKGGTPGRPHLQMHLAQNTIAIKALENALFQDINRKRCSQQRIPGVGEVSAAVKFARICNADLQSVFCLINSAGQKEQTVHRQTLDPSRPIFVPGKQYELRTVFDRKDAPTTSPISPHREGGGDIGGNASRFPNMKSFRSPTIMANPVSIENTAPEDSSITNRSMTTLMSDGFAANEASKPPAFGISMTSPFVETTVAQQTTEPFIQPALQTHDDANVSMDRLRSNSGRLHPAVLEEPK